MCVCVCVCVSACVSVRECVRACWRGGGEARVLTYKVDLADVVQRVYRSAKRILVMQKRGCTERVYCPTKRISLM